jgi:hypothetical protein
LIGFVNSGILEWLQLRQGFPVFEASNNDENLEGE